MLSLLSSLVLVLVVVVVVILAVGYVWCVQCGAGEAVQ